MTAYGRLDIYRPEGPIDSYALEKATIALGRQPGNDIVVDTAGVSRYHFVLELRGDKVYLVDKESQNGTYVDGVKIAPDDPHQLREGEEIQVGDARIVFHASSQGEIPTGEAQRVEAGTQNFNVEIEDSEMSVTPGAHAQTILKIQNLGSVPDTYDLEIDGLPKEWMRLDRRELDVPPGASALVVLSIKPVRRPESRPGIYEAKARVHSKEFPEIVSEVPLKIHVLPYSGFGIVLGTPRVGEDQPFELYTQNQGSGPLPLTFIVRDPAKRLVFEVTPPTVTLNAGEKRTIRGALHPRQPRWFGPTEEVRFDVIAQSRDASGFQVAIAGKFIDKPRLPAWFPLAVLGGGGAIILLLGGLLLLPVLTGALNRTATSTTTPTNAPTVTPVQIDLPSFTPPPSLTPTSTATPTLSATEVQATFNFQVTETSAAIETQVVLLTGTYNAQQTYAAQQTLTAQLTLEAVQTQAAPSPAPTVVASDAAPAATVAPIPTIPVQAPTPDPGQG